MASIMIESCYSHRITPERRLPLLGKFMTNDRIIAAMRPENGLAAMPRNNWKSLDRGFEQAAAGYAAGSKQFGPFNQSRKRDHPSLPEPEQDKRCIANSTPDRNRTFDDRGAARRFLIKSGSGSGPAIGEIHLKP